jgi:TnsA-like endonuclease N terminal/NUMOD3 motif
MILSELKKVDSKYKPQLKDKIQITQFIKIRCDNKECGKEWEIPYSYFLKGRAIYGRDLCLSCKMREQYKKGLREEQKIKAGEGARRALEGKTLEEIWGNKRTKQFRKNHSTRMSGKNNPNFGGLYSHGFRDRPLNIKGKTFEEIYGDERATEYKKKLSRASSGKNNSMYGKPSPQGSGNGWSGWYKGKYFRSFLELSFIINVLEKQKLIWDTGERARYNIPYTDYKGTDRSYYPDFIIENSIIVEIKPHNLRNSKDILLKEEAAKKWCKKHNFEYRIIDEVEKLSDDEIRILHDNELVKFINRYEEKFKRCY